MKNVLLLLVLVFLAACGKFEAVQHGTVDDNPVIVITPPETDEEPVPEVIILPEEDETLPEQIGDFEDDTFKCKSKKNHWKCEKKDHSNRGHKQ